MPKLIQRSSAHCSLQAKKRKRAQREDPVKHQREQESNTATRQQLHVDNPERRQEEQQRNTADHRRIRQENSECRQEEQQHDTIGNISLCVIYSM